MPDLHSDVVGQAARLPLKPSESNALLLDAQTRNAIFFDKLGLGG
ncbi:hypothetical protein [Roseovarius sp. E0-M6]